MKTKKKELAKVGQIRKDTKEDFLDYVLIVRTYKKPEFGESYSERCDIIRICHGDPRYHNETTIEQTKDLSLRGISNTWDKIIGDV